MAASVIHGPTEYFKKDNDCATITIYWVSMFAGGGGAHPGFRRGLEQMLVGTGIKVVFVYFFELDRVPAIHLSQVC